MNLGEHRPKPTIPVSIVLSERCPFGPSALDPEGARSDADSICRTPAFDAVWCLASRTKELSLVSSSLMEKSEYSTVGFHSEKDLSNTAVATSNPATRSSRICLPDLGEALVDGGILLDEAFLDDRVHLFLHLLHNSSISSFKFGSMAPSFFCLRVK
jgi:hypothetical protein